MNKHIHFTNRIPSILAILALVIFILMPGRGWGQTTIASDGLNNSSSLFTISGGAYYTGNSGSGDRPASSPFASEGTHGYGLNATSTTIATATLTTTNNINTVGYTSIQLSFKLAAFSIASTSNGLDGPDAVTVQISTDGGSNYTTYLTVNGNGNAYWPYSGSATATTAYPTVKTVAPTAGGTGTTPQYGTVSITSLPATSTLKVIISLSNNATSERWVIDDFKITGTVASAPTWTLNYPKADNPSATGFTARASISASGSAYFVVLPSGATAPTSAQVKAGQDASGGALANNLKGTITCSAASTEYTSNVTGLASGTTYDVYFVAEASSQLQASPAKVNVTTSSVSAPLVITPTATSITNTSALLGGNITSDGGDAIIARGTVWKTSTGVAITDNPLAEGGTTAGTFSHSRTSLPAKTQIYYKAYATNGIGTTLTNEASFFTLANEPTTHVSSFTAAATSSTAINLTWTAATGADGYLIIQKQGSSAPTGTPTDATGYTKGSTIVDGTVAYDVLSGSATSQSISGLSGSTQYYFTIIPYAYDGLNNQTYNYYTAATIPSATATTTEAVITWDGGAGTSAWSDANNWSGNVVPSTNDIVLLDNSVVSGSYSVNLPSGSVKTSIKRLTITPSGSNNITLTLPVTNTYGASNDAGFVVGDNTSSTDDIIINNGGIIVNSSGGSSGNGIQVNALANGTCRINNGGKYIHNTTRSAAGIVGATGVNTLSSVAGTEKGIFEFAVTGTGQYAFSASGKTYGSLVLTRPDGASTYTTSGSSALTVSGDFTINTGVTFSSSMSAALNIAGNLNNNGQALAIPIGQVVNLNGTTTQNISGASSITFGGNVNITNSTGVAINNSAVTVNGILSLSCVVTTGSNTLTLGPAASISGASASNYIIGKLAQVYNGTGSKTFPIGKGGNYRPLSLNYTALTGTSTVTVEQIEGEAVPGDAPSNTTLWAGRYWTINESGSSARTYSVTLDGTGFSPTYSGKIIKGNGGSTNTVCATTFATPNYTASGLNSFSNFGFGEYIVPTTTTPVDVSVCQGSASVNLTASVAPVPSGGTVQFYINGSTVGSPVAVNTGTGVATLNYDPSALTANAVIRADYSGSGDYLASSSNSDNNKTLTISPLAADAGPITGTATVVQGNSGVAYSVGTIANASSYTWAYDGTGVTINGTGASVTLDFSTSASSGNLTVKGTNTCGDGTVSANFPITVTPLPAKFLVEGGGYYCEGVALTGISVTLSGSEVGVNYELYNGAAKVATLAGTGSSLSFDNQVAGTYTIYGTITGGSRLMDGSAIVTENPKPAVVTVSGGGTLCYSALISASNGSDGTIFYQGTTSNGTSTASQITEKEVLASGTYYFRAQSGAGCWGDEGSAVVTITTPLTPAVSIVVNANPVSSGSGAMFTATPSGVVSTPTYNWFKNGIGVGGNSDTYTYTPVVDGDVVSVDILSSDLCVTSNSASSNQITMSVLSQAPTKFDVTGGDSYCPSGAPTGIPVRLSGSQAGVTYTLYKGGVAQTPTVAGTGSAITFGNQTAGTYTVKANNGGADVDMNGNAVIAADGVVPSAYAGPTNQQAFVDVPYQLQGATATSGATIEWTLSPVSSSGGSLTGTGTLAPIFTATNSGSATFNMKVSTTTPGCIANSSVNIPVTDPNERTWVGGISDEWGNSANWYLSEAPTSTNSVIIPAGSHNFYPRITTEATCKNIRMESGTSLQGNENLTVTGVSVIERDLTAGQWHYFSVPNDVTTANIFYGSYLGQWDEPTAKWSYIYNPADHLYKVKGYRVWNNTGATRTYTFTGDFLSGNQSIPITQTANGTDYKGANLVGNPYPSYIDWSTLNSDYGAVYYWNGSGGTDGKGGYNSWNGTGDGSRYVAPLQGFFIVKDENVAKTSFDLKEVNRSNTVTGPYYKSEAGILSNSLVLRTESGSYSDKLYIVFNPETTESFDLANDAYKFSNSSGISTLYTYAGDKKLSIDARPETETMQLGFFNTNSGQYQIGIQDIADIPVVVLEDTKTGAFHDLKDGAYTFNYDAGESDKRFILHFGINGLKDSEKMPASIYSYQKTIYIDIKDQQKGDIFVYNISGQLVKTIPSARGMNEIKVPVTGNYIVKVVGRDNTSVKKVWIQQ